MATIAVDRLTKRFGPVVAVDNLSFDAPRGHHHRIPRPQRRRQDDHAAHAAGPGRPDQWDGHDRQAALPPTSSPRPARSAPCSSPRASTPGARPGTTSASLATATRTSASRVDVVLDQVGLAEAAGRRVGGFSLGMRQRLAVAAALLGDPEILVLDEPTNGLDPPAVRWLRDLMKRLRGEGRTILVSSHLLAEVAQVVDRVVIIDHGRLVADRAARRPRPRARRRSGPHGRGRAAWPRRWPPTASSPGSMPRTRWSPWPPCPRRSDRPWPPPAPSSTR